MHFGRTLPLKLREEKSLEMGSLNPSSLKDFLQECIDIHFEKSSASYSCNIVDSSGRNLMERARDFFEAKEIKENKENKEYKRQALKSHGFSFDASFQKISNQYTHLLLAALTKLVLFKPLFLKKNEKNLRLISINLLLKRFQSENPSQADQKTWIQNLHGNIFCLIHYDQSEILSFLLKSPFFNHYLKELNPKHFLLFVDYKDILTHAVCRNAVKTIDVLFKNGWKISISHIKKAIEYHAEEALSHLLTIYKLTSKEKTALANYAKKFSNINIIKMFAPDDPLFYFRDLITKLRNHLQDSLTPFETIEFFYSISAAYRFTLEMEVVDDICEKLKSYLSYLSKEFLEEKFFILPIQETINKAKELYPQWANYIAPYRTPADFEELSFRYEGKKNKDSLLDIVKKEIQLGLKYHQFAKSLVEGSYTSSRPNALARILADHKCEQPKGFHSLADLIWIIANFAHDDARERGNKNFELWLEVRNDSLMFSAGATSVGFNIYDSAFPFIETMANIECPDVIQSEDAYYHLYEEKNPRSSTAFVQYTSYAESFTYVKLNCIHGTSYFVNIMPVIAKPHKEIFEMTSTEILKNPEPFLEKIATVVSLLGKAQPMMRGTGTIVQVWLAIVQIFYKLPFLVIKKMQLDLYNIILSTALERKIFLNLFKTGSLHPAFMDYKKACEREPDRQKLLKKFKLGYEDVVEDEKSEWLVSSDEQIIDILDKLNLIEFKMVAKNGDSLLVWLAKHDRMDLFVKLKNIPANHLFYQDLDRAVEIQNDKSKFKEDESQFLKLLQGKQQERSAKRALLKIVEFVEIVGLDEIRQIDELWEESSQQISNSTPKQPLDKPSAGERKSVWETKQIEDQQEQVKEDKDQKELSLLQYVLNRPEIVLLKKNLEEVSAIEGKLSVPVQNPISPSSATLAIQKFIEIALSGHVNIIYSFNSGDLIANWKSKSKFSIFSDRYQLNISKLLNPHLKNKKLSLKQIGEITINFALIKLKKETKAQYIAYVKKFGQFKPKKFFATGSIYLAEQVAINIYTKSAYYQKINTFLRDYGVATSECWQEKGEILTGAAFQTRVQDLLYTIIMASSGSFSLSLQNPEKSLNNSTLLALRGEKLPLESHKRELVLKRFREGFAFKQSSFFSIHDFKAQAQFKPELAVQGLDAMDIYILVLGISTQQSVIDYSATPHEYELLLPPDSYFLCLRHFVESTKHYVILRKMEGIVSLDQNFFQPAEVPTPMQINIRTLSA